MSFRVITIYNRAILILPYPMQMCYYCKCISIRRAHCHQLFNIQNFFDSLNYFLHSECTTFTSLCQTPEGRYLKFFDIFSGRVDRDWFNHIPTAIPISYYVKLYIDCCICSNIVVIYSNNIHRIYNMNIRSIGLIISMLTG